jgi:hypothetical protein
MSHNGEWSVNCLCNHRAESHGLTNYEAYGKIRAQCSECACQVFIEDPTSPAFQSWVDAASDAARDEGLDNCEQGTP